MTDKTQELMSMLPELTRLWWRDIAFDPFGDQSQLATKTAYEYSVHTIERAVKDQLNLINSNLNAYYTLMKQCSIC